MSSSAAALATRRVSAIATNTRMRLRSCFMRTSPFGILDILAIGLRNVHEVPTIRERYYWGGILFIRNAWYVVAWDFEGLADTILERTILGESVIVYRTGDGVPIVMENRCCHRAAPLALGRKEGDRIRCMYHGLLFGPDGVCVEIPGQDRIPLMARVNTFPVVQPTRLIWGWVGDVHKADPGL